MTHTDQCLKYQAELAAAREAWQARWPNYCRKCEGAGGFDVQATRDDPPDYDVCECWNNWHCPRCNHLLEFVNEHDASLDTACPECGWTGRGADDMCPPSFDGCACGEEEEARAVQAMIDAIDLENTHPISELWDSLEDDDPPVLPTFGEDDQGRPTLWGYPIKDDDDPPHPDAPDPYDLTLPPYF